MDTINGTAGILSVNSNYGFFIIDFDHNSEIEGKGISFMGFKTAVNNGVDIAFVDSNYGTEATSGFVMNTTDTNDGGWASSYMKNTVIPSFKQALSSSLKNVIKTTVIYTDNTGTTSIGSAGSNIASNVTATTDSIYLPAEYEIFGEKNMLINTNKIIRLNLLIIKMVIVKLSTSIPLHPLLAVGGYVLLFGIPMATILVV